MVGAPSASTRPGCSPRCSRSAPCWPGSAARCSCRASRPTSAWTWRSSSDAFVVVVVGGMGSIPGAFLAALLIGVLKALCIGIGDVSAFGIDFSFSKLTLVAEFVVMAVVLAVRPWGLLGQRSRHAARRSRGRAAARRPATARHARAAVAVLALRARCRSLVADRYTLVAAHRIAGGRAVRRLSLHFLMGPGGMAVLRPRRLVRPRRLRRRARCSARAADGGWRCCWRRSPPARRARLRLVLRAPVRRLPRHADAGLRPDRLGGGLPVGRCHRRRQRPGRHLAGGLARRPARLLLSGARCSAPAACWRCGASLFSPFGYALRAGRDSPLRAEAHRHRRAPACNGALRARRRRSPGWPAALYAFSKGSISPDSAVDRPLGGRAGDGAAGRRADALRPGRRRRAPSPGLHDTLARATDYWRAVLGARSSALVLAFPQGIAGAVASAWSAGRRTPHEPCCECPVCTRASAACTRSPA